MLNTHNDAITNSDCSRLNAIESHSSKETNMLSLTIQKLGDVSVFQCAGRLTAGEAVEQDVVTILKGIFLKGVGLSVLWGELGFLALFALIVFLLATRKLNQKLV